MIYIIVTIITALVVVLVGMALKLHREIQEPPQIRTSKSPAVASGEAKSSYVQSGSNVDDTWIEVSSEEVALIREKSLRQALQQVNSHDNNSS